jgi:hypothetical protein
VARIARRSFSISINTALSIVVFLSITVNHSHMNALCRHKSKAGFSGIFGETKTPPGGTRRREGEAMIRYFTRYVRAFSFERNASIFRLSFLISVRLTNCRNGCTQSGSPHRPPVTLILEGELKRCSA